MDGVSDILEERVDGQLQAKVLPDNPRVVAGIGSFRNNSRSTRVMSSVLKAYTVLSQSVVRPSVGVERAQPDGLGLDRRGVRGKVNENLGHVRSRVEYEVT